MSSALSSRLVCARPLAKPLTSLSSVADSGADASSVGHRVLLADFSGDVLDCCSDLREPLDGERHL